MYERLPLDFIGITEDFGLRRDPITGVSNYHYAVDFGWHNYQGEPIYAVMDSYVVLESYDDNLGNYIVLRYDKGDSRIINRFLHMKARSTLRNGDFVKRGSIIGYMGSTGYSTGTHLHFEYWICPKGYNYNYNDRSKYAVDPLKYCYLFSNQTASKDSIAKLLKVVGNPTKEDKNKRQVLVVNSGLNCRNNPSLSASILGYIDFGYYNILDEVDKDNYTWFKVGDNMWIANVSSDVVVKNNCDDILKENENLKLQVENQKKVINDLLNEKGFKNMESFKSLKKDYYYILLDKDEVIYYPK